MTKQGYNHIIVPKQLHSQLKSLAKQNGLSISQLITKLIAQPSINTAPSNQRTSQNLSLSQALNQQNSQKQDASQKGKEWKPAVSIRRVRWDLNPRSPANHVNVAWKTWKKPGNNLRKPKILSAAKLDNSC